MRQEGAAAQQLDSLFVRAASHLDPQLPHLTLSAAKIYIAAPSTLTAPDIVLCSLFPSDRHSSETPFRLLQVLLPKSTRWELELVLVDFVDRIHVPRNACCVSLDEVSLLKVCLVWW